MATKNFSYDAPEYNVRKFHGATLTGASGRISLCAYQAMLVKSVQAAVITAGTVADTLTSYKITGTTTSTVALHTNTSATGNLGNFTSTFTLAQGDVFQILKGSDATAVYSIGVELAAVTGADVTV